MSFYLVIDLKSFYASVECVERGLDPMTTNLVVADPDRSDKTICLAVSPSLKKLGVRNRCRVFEIPPHLDYIMAEPRMQKYIDYAARIYALYLRYMAPKDIHVYSIDEAFLDISPYLERYNMTPKEMAVFLMDKISEEIGVRSTAGIGTNLYLAKIALDITAKHAPDFIGELDEETYRATLWNHRPLTDFWRIGKGIAEKLSSRGIFTMRDIAYADSDMLYDLFGVDAELLIDHAWGKEPTTIADIKAYKPKVNSLSQGQVLMRDYNIAETEIIVKEMMEALCFNLLEKSLVTNSLGLFIRFAGGGGVNGSICLEKPMALASILIPKMSDLYRSLMSRVNENIAIRGVQMWCGGVMSEEFDEQISLMFEDSSESDKKSLSLEKSLLGIKKKYGKNAILRGIDFEDAATTRERNMQIGGHKRG